MHYESARHGSDARGSLDNLESGTKHVAGRVGSTGHLTIGFAGFNEKASEVKRILCGLGSIFHAYALSLAKFVEQLYIFLNLFGLVWVNDTSLVDVG